MLDKLYFVSDIMERYRCSAPTARRYMNQMEHTKRPLTVTEQAIADWEEAQRKPAAAQREAFVPAPKPTWRKQINPGGHIVPRVQPY